MHSHRVERNVCIVPTGATLTLDTPAQFKHYVVDLLEGETYAGLVIECSTLQRIDSFGIGVVVGLFKTAREKGVPFGVANLSESHRKLFAATGIDQVLDLYASEADALESMAG